VVANGHWEKEAKNDRPMRVANAVSFTSNIRPLMTERTRARGRTGRSGTDLLLSVSGIERNGAVTLLSKRNTLVVILPSYGASLTAIAGSSGDGGSHL
jgi:hypothetical protein